MLFNIESAFESVKLIDIKHINTPTDLKKCKAPIYFLSSLVICNVRVNIKRFQRYYCYGGSIYLCIDGWSKVMSLI